MKGLGGSDNSHRGNQQFLSIAHLAYLVTAQQRSFPALLNQQRLIRKQMPPARMHSEAHIRGVGTV